MALLALAVYVLGLGLAFGWRSVVQWRRTGDTGLRLDAGPVGSLRWWAKLLFIAALLFGAEGPGLSPGTLAAADVRAVIPMRGGVDSLNVGVAAGIAFWVLGRAGRHPV